MQPFRLPQFEDLAVVESVNFVLEELQGGRLTRQSPGDLLPHHLHHLRTDMGAQTGYMLLRTGRRMEAGIGVSRLGFDITRARQPAYLTRLCTMVEH